MIFEDLLKRIEQQASELVWWTPSQIERNEHVENNPKKGERPWSIPRETGEFLHEFILKHQPQNILELGTSIGYSTVWMAHAAQTYGGYLHSIEFKKYKYDIARKNISDGGLEHTVTLYNAPIIDVIQQLNLHLSGEKLDLVFMDADRGHYHEYFPVLEPHLAKTATLLADNAINMQDRMKPFLDMFKEKEWDLKIMNIDNGILIATKKQA